MKKIFTIMAMRTKQLTVHVPNNKLQPYITTIDKQITYITDAACEANLLMRVSLPVSMIPKQGESLTMHLTPENIFAVKSNKMEHAGK